MQSARIFLIIIGVLLAGVSGIALSETLQPDPAWQEGKLDNGFSWQILDTPQRPSDRIELRLLVKTGSLVESLQQAGFAHFLARIAVANSANLSAEKLQLLRQEGINKDNPQPFAVSSYDFTIYNLSLPNNRPELLKDALEWFADTAGSLVLDEHTIETAAKAPIDPVGTFPANPQESWWRYRLKGSSLLSHTPSLPVNPSINPEQLKAFYQKWYTPDVMTLYVVGKVDSRALSEQLTKRFSSLEGKRDTPTPLPTLAPLSNQPIQLITDQVSQSTLSIMWDMPWLPIRDSKSLNQYWLSDFGREALFLRLQQVLEKKPKKNNQLGFDCRVQYQRAQCALHLSSPAADVANMLALIARELANVRDNGLQQQELDALLAQKTEQLNKLFATYARITTNVLMNQRLRSQQSGVVDIAPEQYQRLRQAFLANVTLGVLNQELKSQLTKETTLVLQQPKGEAELNMQQLQDIYQRSFPQPVVPIVDDKEDKAKSEVEQAH